MNIIKREVLSQEELRRFVPAAFSKTPSERMSDKYAHYNTHSIVQYMDTLGWKPVSAKQQKTRLRKGQPTKRVDVAKHQIRFASEEPQKIFEGGSNETHFEAVLTNSHDGSSSYIFEIGAFRLVCSNGLVVQAGSIGQVRVRHMGYDDHDIRQAIESVLGNFATAKEYMEEYSKIRLTQKQQARYAETAMLLRWPEEYLVKTSLSPEVLLEAHRKEDTSNDLYTVFNRVQENLVRGSFRYEIEGGKRKFATARPIKSIAQNQSINRNLWDLTHRVAEKAGV